MKREKFKTLTLSVLFLLSIALIYFNIGVYPPFFNIQTNYIEKSINFEENLKFTLRPERMFIHFGGGNNTEIINNKDEYWKEINNILKENLSSKSKLIPIDHKDYSDKKDIKSIELTLNSKMNGRLFNKSIGLKTSQIDELENINEVVISLLNDKGLYFLADNKAYKIKLYNLNNIELINKLEKERYIKYHTIKDIANINNKILIPVFDFKNDITTNDENINLFYPMIKTKNVFNFADEKFIQDIAKKILKDKYAFSNKTVETNGMTTFIYGFGENALRMYPSGYFEFLNESAAGKDMGVEKSLYKAIQFIMSFNLDLKNIYLGDITESSIKDQKIYTFGFYYTQDNLRVKINNMNYPIEVKIKGDSVYSYKSLLKNSNYVYNSREYIIQPQDVLNKNFETFKRDLHYVNAEELLKNIKSTELMYFLNENNNFIPVWEFVIGKKVYIFDAYKGDNLKYGLGES